MAPRYLATLPTGVQFLVAVTCRRKLDSRGQSGNIRGLTILRTLLYQLSTAIFFLQPPTSTLYKYALYQFISWERVVRRTNEVTHTSVPVSTEMGDRLRAGMPSPYVTSQLGLCILPGSMNRVPCSGNVIYAAWQVTLVRYGM